jgi:hypothetical protein
MTATCSRTQRFAERGDNRIARRGQNWMFIIQVYRCGLRGSGVAGIYWFSVRDQ